MWISPCGFCPLKEDIDGHELKLPLPLKKTCLKEGFESSEICEKLV